MTRTIALLIGLVCVAGVLGQDDSQSPAKRYGISLDAREFPQDTPKKTLESALKAISDRRVDYLLAHLADPQFVDERVRKNHAGKFDEFVKESASKLSNEPESIKQLHRFLKEGEWEEGAASASARLKDVKERVFLRKVKDRWYLENRLNAEKTEE